MLVAFSKERNSDAQTIEQHLQEHPNSHGIDLARKVSHALKGLAGNLSMTDIEAGVKNIDLHLKNNNIKGALLETPVLDEAMKLTIEAISKITLPKNEASKKPPHDTDKMTALLKTLRTALREFDPDVSAPYLEELNAYLDKEDLAAIYHSIQKFDFEEAKIAVDKLAHQKNLTIDGAI